MRCSLTPQRSHNRPAVANAKRAIQRISSRSKSCSRSHRRSATSAAADAGSIVVKSSPSTSSISSCRHSALCALSAPAFGAFAFAARALSPRRAPHFPLFRCLSRALPLPLQFIAFRSFSRSIDPLISVSFCRPPAPRFRSWGGGSDHAHSPAFVPMVGARGLIPHPPRQPMTQSQKRAARLGASSNGSTNGYAIVRSRGIGMFLSSLAHVRAWAGVVAGVPCMADGPQ